MIFPPIWGAEKARRKGLKNGLIGYGLVETPGSITSSPATTIPSLAASSTPTPTPPPAKASSAAICLRIANAVDPQGSVAILDDIAIVGVALAATLVIMVITSPPFQEIVYNAAKATNTFISDAGRIAADTWNAKKPTNLPSWKKLKVDTGHILSGHTAGGSRNPNGNKTIFHGLNAYQILRAIQEAYNHSSKIKTQGERILLRGFSNTYNLIIEIWLNLEKMVIETAYPVN